MKKLPFAVFFIILIVGAYFVLSSEKGMQNLHGTVHRAHTSTTRMKSPYSKVFNRILNMSTYENASSISILLYGKEYLWPGLSHNSTHPCSLTDNITYMMSFINRTMEEFINASEENVEENNTVGALLLGDMMNALAIPIIETAIISKGYANYSGYLRLSSVQEAYTTACTINSRIENLSAYERIALERYGRPPFNLSSLEKLNRRIRPYLSYTPMNGTQIINWRATLENLIYVLTYNRSLLNRFATGYTPKKAADILLNFTEKVNSNPYLKSVFKPALVYLTILRIQDITMENKKPVETDLFYLKVFYAWYNIVKPYTLWR